MSTKNLLLNHALKKLRLPVFLSEYEAAARQAGHQNWNYPEYLEHLADAELKSRQAKRIQRLLKQAAFPGPKELSDFNFAAVPSLNRGKVLELARTEFTERRENIILLGPPGVGKTHLAIALGRECCRQGKKVRFYTAAGVSNLCAEAKDEKRLLKLEAQVRKSDVVILDELGYLPFDRRGAEHLFQFFSNCYEQVSVVITTNLPFSEWPAVFADDERLTGALLDRLTHKSHILEFAEDEESYRIRMKLKAMEATHRKEVKTENKSS